MFAKNVDVAHQPCACAAAVTLKAAAESAQMANVHDPLPVSMAFITPGWDCAHAQMPTNVSSN